MVFITSVSMNKKKSREAGIFVRSDRDRSYEAKNPWTNNVLIP